MTRLHFNSIAEAISAIENQEKRRELAQLMADICARSNPRFNYSRFYAACNVEA